MIESLTFITGNKAKVEWLQRHVKFPVSYQKLDLEEIQSLDLETVVRKKTEMAYRALQKPVIVDDTSLLFNAMGKLPGPLIKWFLDELKTEGLCRLLDTYSDRSAVAHVMYGLHTGSEILTFDATVLGSIAQHPFGDKGFGWDSAFIPDGQSKTWGEMSLEEQDDTGLRVQAIRKLNEYLGSENRTRFVH